MTFARNTPIRERLPSKAANLNYADFPFPRSALVVAEGIATRATTSTGTQVLMDVAGLLPIAMRPRRYVANTKFYGGRSGLPRGRLWPFMPSPQTALVHGDKHLRPPIPPLSREPRRKTTFR